ncbi:MAG: alpha-amylase [Erysipelotrichaceae bacterium]|nr:alpha-amylase [Erysipelotrichaceae bacterium]
MIRKVVLSFLLLLSLVGCQKEVYDSDVYYEIFVGSFNDSNNDGIGDLNGVIEKLGYLKSLGIKGIWLMPIMESDTYHKYDVNDYYKIDSDYGTMEDFKKLVKKADNLGIDIIIDLPLNHTSDTHSWFVEAKTHVLNGTCDTSDKCNYYNFSETQESGYEYLVNNVYYEARFWSEMPDLNLSDENLRKEIEEIVNFWLDTGIKGFRLDAILYYYQNNVGDNNEFVSWLMDVIHNKKENAFVVGEVWSSNNVILDHYNSGIDSLFDFGISGQEGAIAKAINSSNGKYLSENVLSNFNQIKSINDKAINSIFLSNHDQSRSAGYYNDLNKQKLAASLYLLSPGIPFIYYGEEIGMKGSGKDENKRLAMLWGKENDANNPINSDYPSQINSSVKLQEKDKDSLLNHYKKVISLRNKYIVNKNVNKYEVDNQNIFALDYDGIIVLINLNEDNVIVNIDKKIIGQIGDSKIIGSNLDISGYGLVILEDR